VCGGIVFQTAPSSSFVNHHELAALDAAGVDVFVNRPTVRVRHGASSTAWRLSFARASSIRRMRRVTQQEERRRLAASLLINEISLLPRLT